MDKTTRRIVQKVKNNIEAIYENTKVEKEAIAFRKKLGFLLDIFQMCYSKKKKEVNEGGVEWYILSFFLELNETLRNPEYATKEGMVEFKQIAEKEFKKIIQDIEPEYKDKNGTPIKFEEKLKWSSSEKDTFEELTYIGHFIFYFLNKGIEDVCMRLKINPTAWSLYVLSKFFAIPKEDALKHAEMTVGAYLPKINSNLTIQINELTTIEDVKAMWHRVKVYQKSYGKKFKQVKRGYITHQRGARAYELQKQGLTYMEIHQQLKKEGFSSAGYDAIGDILNFHKKFIEDV